MRRDGLVDLNEAVQNPGRRLTFDIETELEKEEDLDLLAPVVGVLEAISTGNVLLVNGEFTTKCVLECARCGSGIPSDIAFKMNDEFDVEGVPSSYGSDGYAEVVCEEPYELFVKNGLDLDTYVRQGLLVSLPIQPLCSGSWDVPCPTEVKLSSGSELKGHPAMMELEKFRKEGEN